MRTLGFHRHAKRHAALLDDENRAFFKAYTDGVNAYITRRQSEHPLEFRLAGFKPEPWAIEDALSVLYLMGWGSAANINHEIIAQILIETVGLEKAREIFPLNVNPDDTGTTPTLEVQPPLALEAPDVAADEVARTPALELEAPLDDTLDEEFPSTPTSLRPTRLEETAALGLDLLADEALARPASGRGPVARSRQQQLGGLRAALA
jgi:acyl-homoserine lactone acylase PvdQ